MSTRFDPPSDPKEPQSGDQQIDLSKRYDVYYCERDQRVVVYRNALFKGIKQLFPGKQFETPFGHYIEVEQSNGKTVFLHRHGVVSFCEPGTELTAEIVTRK